MGYVPQYVERDDQDTVIDWLLAEHRSRTADLHLQEEKLAHSTGKETQRALRAYQRVRDEYDRVEADSWPQRAQTMLSALGLSHKKGQQVASLSGGDKNVLSLTHALLLQPEFLVLDEPANHLDFLGVAWLEDFLSRFKGAVLIVSHNRHLLDRVVGGILTLENGGVSRYEGGYSTYRATMLRDLISQQADYVANQKRLAQLEEQVKRFAQIARSNSDPAWGKRLRARRSVLEREKAHAVEKPILDQSQVRAEFTTERTRSNIALQLRGYEKSFGDLRLFENVDLDIASGERVALVGPNGSGKTSLLHDLVETGGWDNETIRIGPSLRVGYAAQQQEVLDSGQTVLDAIRAVAPMSANEAFAVLRKFLFGWDDLDKRVEQLSGGERNRLQLARIMALKPNFLVLDEPTNHLDIPTREAVEEALDGFEGTILVVSHDRYFLDRVADRVVEVRDRRLESYSGNFSDFWSARQQSASQAVRKIGKRRVRARPRATPRKVEKQPSNGVALEELERRIEEAENEKQSVERRMADAFGRNDYREGRRLERQLDRAQALLDGLYEEWEAASQ